MDLCGKSSGFADFEDPVDRGSAVIFLTRIPDCACRMFGSRVLNEIWIIDLPSALVGILFCHQACCHLYYLGENNSGIHMYQFTFQPLHFCFWMWLWFRIWTKISADRRIWRKKRHGSADLHTPIHPPPLSYGIVVDFKHSHMPRIPFSLSYIMALPLQEALVKQWSPW